MDASKNLDLIFNGFYFFIGDIEITEDALYQ